MCVDGVVGEHFIHVGTCDNAGSQNSQSCEAAMPHNTLAELNLPQIPWLPAKNRRLHGAQIHRQSIDITFSHSRPTQPRMLNHLHATSSPSASHLSERPADTKSDCIKAPKKHHQ
ncbi:uncharacterized protein MYCGRDRAFT_106631, partial [Zymoseptoria tritici IPO323]